MHQKSIFNFFKNKKAQISLEQIAILVGIFILLFIIYSIIFASPDVSLKINQSKIYWTSVATPFKLSDYALSIQEGTDALKQTLYLKILNPTTQNLVIRKISINKAKFEDVYDSTGNYLGKASNLYIKFLPNQQKEIFITSYQLKSDSNLYFPSKVFELNLKIMYDSALPSQIQTSQTPITDYLASFIQTNQSFFAASGCQNGFVPCPDTNNCVPPQYCINNNYICTPPNFICNNNCCAPGQVCFEGSCSSNPTCLQDQRLCCDSNNNCYCIDNTQICTPSGPKKCTSPNSVVCNTVCCPDGQFCDWQNSRCLSTCQLPDFPCPPSNNCCDANTYSYCDPNTGNCLANSECSAPKHVCGPDQNGITYCCAQNQYCNSTTFQCENCAANQIGCGSNCCPPNFDCLDGSSCYCPPERSYYIDSTLYCCPPGQIYNQTTQSCEPCAQNTFACKDKCCLNSTLCDTSTSSFVCINCCPDNSYNCLDLYCCNYSSACVIGSSGPSCVQVCQPNQIACKGPTGYSCCSSNQYCIEGVGCVNNCDQGLTCGKFCCQEGQYCYDGRCVSQLPPNPKCTEYNLVCPDSRLCGGVGLDNFGNPILIPTTCCPAGTYCANNTGTCCTSQPCLFNDSGIIKGNCCAQGETCVYNSTNSSVVSTTNMVCCSQEQRASYTAYEGPSDNFTSSTFSFSTMCDSTNGPICCPSPSACINDSFAGNQVCCNESSICLVGSGPISFRYWTCCPPGYNCGAIGGQGINNYSKLNYTCCPPNRQVSIQGDSNTLPYNCCPEGNVSIGGDSCCDQNKACNTSSGMTCCAPGTICAYPNYQPWDPSTVDGFCCPPQNILVNNSYPYYRCCLSEVKCKNNSDNTKDCSVNNGNPYNDSDGIPYACPGGCHLACDTPFCQGQNITCQNSSGLNCCDPSPPQNLDCLNSSTTNEPMCCPPPPSPPTSPTVPPVSATKVLGDQITTENVCCTDQNQLVQNSTGTYCCVNTNDKIYIKCENNAPTDPSRPINPSCCEQDKCKRTQTVPVQQQSSQDVYLCCPSSTDELCNIGTLSVENYICCHQGQCAEPQGSLNGKCCPVGTIRCSHPAVVECCNASSDCLDNPDPENPSTYCCPSDRYVPQLQVDQNGLWSYGEPVCCPHTRLGNRPDRGNYCCPDGYIPSQTGPPCILDTGGGGGGTSP